MEKKCKKAKWLSGEALQIPVKTREAKAKEKRKDISISIQSSKGQIQTANNEGTNGKQKQGKSNQETREEQSRQVCPWRTK